MKNKNRKSFGEIWCELTNEQTEYLRDFINRQKKTERDRILGYTKSLVKEVYKLKAQHNNKELKQALENAETLIKKHGRKTKKIRN